MSDMDIVNYLHHAAGLAAGAADEESVAMLTILIDAINEGRGDDPTLATTGTTATTGSSGALTTIMEECGLAPDKHQRDEHVIITEVKRLRGELHQERTEREAAQADVTRISQERNSMEARAQEYADEIERRRANEVMLRDTIDTMVANYRVDDIDQFDRSGLNAIAVFVGVPEPESYPNKASLVAAINGDGVAPDDPDTNEEEETPS